MRLDDLSAECRQPRKRMVHLILQALALEETGGVRLMDLQQRLRLPLAMLQRVLAGMNEQELVARFRLEIGSGADRGRCLPSDAAGGGLVPWALPNADMR